MKYKILFAGIIALYSSLSFGLDIPMDVQSSITLAKEKFNKLKLDTQADLHIHLGDKVSLDISKNQAALSFKTDKGMLTISTGSVPSSNAEAEIWAQKLDTIVLASAGDIDIVDMNQRDLDIILSGAGTIHITGHVDNLTATISGAGDLNLEDLVCENAHIISKGAGSSNINVRGTLRAEVSGAGDIIYRGKPSRVIPKKTGAGSIKSYEKLQEEEEAE